MANRDFNKQQALEHGVKEVFAEFSVAHVAAEATLNVSTDIVLTSVATGYARNDSTFELVVNAAAANPTDTVLVAFTGTAEDIVCTVTPNDGTNNDTVAATSTLDLSTDIVLTSVALGAQRNTETFQLVVNAAAANTGDEVLVAFTGTAAAIVCTVTPNDGTNNAATPVDLSEDQLTELINTGAVAAFTGGGAGTLVLTDASSRRILQTATGGGAAPNALVAGDNQTVSFTGGVSVAVSLDEDELTELINTGLVAGKTITLTDGSSLRALQTAAGGAAANALTAADDQVVTFAGGEATATDNSVLGIASISQTDTGLYVITLDDAYNSIKAAHAIHKSSTAEDLSFQIKAEDVDVAKTVSIQALAGAVATDPADGTSILVKLELKNSSVED